MKAYLLTTALFLSIFNFAEAQISVTSNVDNCLCGGIPQKAFSVIAEGAAGPFSFHWAGPYNYASEYKEPIDVREPGLYTLSVTNTYGCTFSYEIEIPACPPLNIFPEAIDPATCPEAANGIVALSAEGGAPPYIVTWSDGAAGFYNSALAAGDYQATVTDANGCTASTAFTVQALSGITLDAVVTPLQCADGPDGAISLTVHGERGPVSYFWEGPEYPIGVNSSQVTGLSAGNYCVTVTDVAGCQASGCWEVEIGEVVYPPYLSRVEVFVEVGGVYQPVYRAEWLPNSQGCLKYVKDETVEISDEALDALANDAPVLVTVVSSQPLSSITLELLGAGLSLGGSDIQAGTGWVFEFTANTSQILNGGIVNQRLSFSGTGAGPQQYYLLNMNGYLDNTLGCAVLPEIQPDCSWEPDFARGSDQSHVLQRLCSVDAGLSATVTNSEEGGCSGSIQLEIRGMTPPFKVLLEGSGESIHFEGNSQVYPFEGLCPEEYNIEVIDANGCTLLLQEKVEECMPFIAKPVIVHSTNCDEEEGDGSITYTPESILNGTPPYSFAWSNGGTGNAISGLSPGMYSATITDSRGCQSVFSHIISMETEPGIADLLVEIVEVQPDANGDCSGSITVNIYYTGSPDIIFQVSGGGIYESMTLYTITWPFDENVVLENLCAGTYNISVWPNVFPGNGSYCRIELEAEVLSCPGFEMGASPTIVRPENCNASNGSISYGEESPAGGTPPYLWMWSTGESSPYSIEGLSPGTYSLTVVDDNGCVIEKTFGLTVPSDAGLLAVAAFEQPMEGGCNGSITVSGVAGTEVALRDQNGNIVAGPVQLSSDTYTFSSLCPASPYYITAKDGSMCQSTIQQSLTGCNELTLPFLEITGPSDCEAEDGLIRIISPSGGGLPPYDYVLFDESGNSYDLPWEGLAQGLYTLIVSDATGGCESKHEIELVSEASPQIILDYVKGECEDEMNGEIHFAVSTGMGANEYSYTFINETTGEQQFIPSDGGVGIFEGLSTGNYTFIITDLHTECTLVQQYFVDEIISRGDFQLSGDGYTVQKSCPFQDTGEATFHISGGNPPYTVSITDITDDDEPETHSKTTGADVPLGVVDVNFSGLPPGEYVINYITDFCDRAVPLGGEYDRNFIIEALPEMNINITDKVCCPGLSSAEAFVTGGTPPYTYEWSNGGTNNLIQNLNAGGYTVTVTDNERCYQQKSVEVDVIQPPVVNASEDIGYACDYENNSGVHLGHIGKIVLNGVSGGMLLNSGDNVEGCGINTSLAPNYQNKYRIEWSTGSQANVINGLGVGNYSLSVTDGCGVYTQDFSIGEGYIDTSQPETPNQPEAEGTCWSKVLCGSYQIDVEYQFYTIDNSLIENGENCMVIINCNNGAQITRFGDDDVSTNTFDGGEDQNGDCFCKEGFECRVNETYNDQVDFNGLRDHFIDINELGTVFIDAPHELTEGEFLGNGVFPCAQDEITVPYHCGDLFDICRQCLPDQDVDGIPDENDNCPEDANNNQLDEDGDGLGNVCDNCPNDYNENQEDGDEDGVGDDCDGCPSQNAGDCTGNQTFCNGCCLSQCRPGPEGEEETPGSKYFVNGRAGQENAFIEKVYPNPFENTVYFEFSEPAREGLIEIRVFNSISVNVHTVRYAVEDGQKAFTIKLPNTLPEGIYWFQVSASTGERAAFELLKIK